MSSHRAGSARRWQFGSRAALLALLLLILGADAYAIYKVHIERLGNALDFYPFWAGGRAVLVHHRNPYDPEITLQTQQAIYGRPALPEENQHAYAYPAHAPFIVWPFLLLPFSVSTSLWITSQQILVVAAVALTIRAAGWRPGRWHFLALCLAAMTFRYSMITFVLGQTAIWVLFCLALAIWAARHQRDGLAGLALAAGALKPQLVILPALALLVVLPARRRRRVLLALGCMLGLLVGLSWLLVGPWLADYLHRLQAYQDYSTTEFPVMALAQTWLSQSASQVLNIVAVTALLTVLAALLWRWRSRGRPTAPMAIAVAVTQLAVPQTGSYNLVLLLLPALVTLHRLNLQCPGQRWRSMAGQLLVWGDLMIEPWLLWPLVQNQTHSAWDIVLVPALLLAVMLVLALGPGQANERQALG